MKEAEKKMERSLNASISKQARGIDCFGATAQKGDLRWRFK